MTHPAAPPRPSTDPDTPEGLIACYSSAVWGIAYSFRAACRLNVAVGVDDLYSVGLFALLEARRQYDPRRGTRFLTWAYPAIRWAMVNALGRAAFVPRHARRPGQVARWPSAVRFRDDDWLALVWPERGADTSVGFGRLLRLAGRHCSPGQARRRRLILEAIYVRGERPCEVARRLGINRRSLEQQVQRILRSLRGSLRGPVGAGDVAGVMEAG